MKDPFYRGLAVAGDTLLRIWGFIKAEDYVAKDPIAEDSRADNPRVEGPRTKDSVAEDSIAEDSIAKDPIGGFATRKYGLTVTPDSHDWFV